MSSSPTSALGPSDNPWGEPSSSSSPTLGHNHDPTLDEDSFELSADDDEADFQDVDLPSSPTTLPPPPAAATSPIALPPPTPTAPRPLSHPPTLNRGLTGETERSGGDFNLNPTLKSPEGFGGFDAEGMILGVLVVNFNHLLGPVIEFAHPPNILASPSLDPELARLMPFLALPDGAHLSEEDYSYFSVVSTPQGGHPPGPVEEEPFPINQTVFGISCNRQLAASELLNRPSDVTRSTVQMAVVVLARQPVFGPIREKLGVVTRAFFAQRDFTSTDILVDFYSSLHSSMRGKVSESTMHMGTSLRELIHKFRHRTLTLLKLMLLQKKIMFFGYPVERLCTYQYTLVSLIPGLLMALNDCGSPTLDALGASVEAPSSLNTSDRPSLLRFFGFPLNIFGKDAFFQPYLPLQQIDMCRSKSWLLGTTNSIMLQQRDAAHDCLVNIEHTTFEFSDPKIERLVALTSADRRWMDEIVKTVEETWNPEDPTRPLGMVFRGSDDFLRAKFEEYLCSLLSSMKYSDYLTKTPNADPLVTSGGGNLSQSLAQFSTPWVKEFRTTPAFQSWDKVTDPVLFDIWEPKHPSDGKANPVSDIGLRLAEGLHDLHLQPPNLAPAQAALSSAFTTSSTHLFRAFEGVRSGISAQINAASAPSSPTPQQTDATPTTAKRASHPLSDPAPATDLRAALGGFGSFWGAKVRDVQGRFAAASAGKEMEEIVPVDLDAKRAAAAAAARADPLV